MANAVIIQAAEVVRQGGVICYPTEAVWGLGCHPMDFSAVSRIMKIKRRCEQQGVILVASRQQQLAPYISASCDVLDKAEAYWPGFVTCVLTKSAICPDYLSGCHMTIAVRVSAFATIQQLCELAQSALVSTSANRHGEPPLKTLAAARSVFADSVDYYVDEPLGGALKPSRIIGFDQHETIVIRD